MHKRAFLVLSLFWGAFGQAALCLFIMQSTRSNLQLKLIDDARKLLEKARVDDHDAPSIESSLHSSESTRKMIQAPLSPSKFSDIIFIQKSLSQQELDDESIGNISCSQDNNAYTTSASSTKKPTSHVPDLTSLSFASSLSKDSMDESNGHSSSTSKGMNCGQSSDSGNAPPEQHSADEEESEIKGGSMKSEKTANVSTFIQVKMKPVRKAIVLGARASSDKASTNSEPDTCACTETVPGTSSSNLNNAHLIYLRNVVDKFSEKSASKSVEECNVASFDRSGRAAIEIEIDSKTESKELDTLNSVEVDTASGFHDAKSILPDTNSNQSHSGDFIPKTNTKKDQSQNEDKRQIQNLKEQNKILLSQNKSLQLDMKTFDEKLACLEETLGIIGEVERSRNEFDRQLDCDHGTDEREESNPLELGEQVSSSISYHSLDSVRSKSSQQSNEDTSSKKGLRTNAENTEGDDATHQSGISIKSSVSQQSSIFHFSKCNQVATGIEEKLSSNEKTSQGDALSLAISIESQRSSECPLESETEKENLDSDSRSYTSAVSHESTASQKSANSYISARSTNNSNQSHEHLIEEASTIAPEKIQPQTLEARDDKNQLSRERTDSETSKGSTTSKLSLQATNSLSSKDKKELQMLRDNNEKMLCAIKALSRATTIQTRKHYHYKKKFGFSKKILKEGNEKITQLEVDKQKHLSEFYEARANYLEEQDKREELSDAVQTLAKRMNSLRRQMTTEEQTKMTILDRIDEHSISSDSSGSLKSVELSSASSSNLSLSSSLLSMDSLDLILSPISENEPRCEDRSTFKSDAEQQSKKTVQALELEIARLKRKLDKKQSQVLRLCRNFKLVKEYLSKESNEPESVRGDDNGRNIVVE